ncbi:hypothetical protein L1887_20000 [Cichorium endivia]|nr:hypothetical protein L1887_20000 [Cichorium endivia]
MIVTGVGKKTYNSPVVFYPPHQTQPFFPFPLKPFLPLRYPPPPLPLTVSRLSNLPCQSPPSKPRPCFHPLLTANTPL